MQRSVPITRSVCKDLSSYLHPTSIVRPVMGYLIGGRCIATEGVEEEEDASSVVIAIPTVCGGSRDSNSSSSERIFISDMLPIGHSYPAGPILQIAGEIVRSIKLASTCLLIIRSLCLPSISIA